MLGIVNEVICHFHTGQLGRAELVRHTHARERHLSKPIYIVLTFVGRLNNSVRHGFLGNFRGHNAE